MRTHELGIASHISLSTNAVPSWKNVVISLGHDRPGIPVVVAGVGVLPTELAGTFPWRYWRYFPLVKVVQGVKELPACSYFSTAAFAFACGFNSCASVPALGSLLPGVICHRPHPVVAYG